MKKFKEMEYIPLEKVDRGYKILDMVSGIIMYGIIIFVISLILDSLF